MRRLFALSITALAVVFLLSYAIPAIGGPQAISSKANPVKLAKRALKKANAANKRANRAEATANQVLGKVSRNGGFLAANVQTVISPPIGIPAGATAAGSVACPPGTIVISGGYTLQGPEASANTDHKKAGENAWEIIVDNAVGTVPASVVVEAQCAGTGSALIARSER